MKLLIKTVLTWSFLFHSLAKAEENYQLPSELSGYAGHEGALLHSGVSNSKNFSAIRKNPARLSLSKTYVGYAGYHWPKFGRNYYTLGVVDSKTSSVAAGFLYTALEKPENSEPEIGLKKRISLSLSKMTKSFSLGAGAQIIEIENEQAETEKETTFQMGVFGLLREDIHFGISVENIGNNKIKEYAPQHLRAGIVKYFLSDRAFLGAEYTKRGISELGFDVSDADPLAFTINEDDQERPNSENIYATNFGAKVYDFYSLVGSLGISDYTKETFMSAGVILTTNIYSFSYIFQKESLAKENSVHMASLSLAIGM